MFARPLLELGSSVFILFEALKNLGEIMIRWQFASKFNAPSTSVEINHAAKYPTGQPYAGSHYRRPACCRTGTRGQAAMIRQLPWDVIFYGLPPSAVGVGRHSADNDRNRHDHGCHTGSGQNVALYAVI
jgi:hypothetical protein